MIFARQPKCIPCSMGDQLVFSPGLYWRGIRITAPAYSVEVLPGLYIVPFSTYLVHVKAGVQVLYMDISSNIRWVSWKRSRWGLWFPALRHLGQELAGEPK